MIGNFVDVTEHQPQLSDSLVSKTVPIAATVVVVILASVVYSVSREADQSASRSADALVADTNASTDNSAVLDTDLAIAAANTAAYNSDAESALEDASGVTETDSPLDGQVGRQSDTSEVNAVSISDSIDFARSIAQDVMTDAILKQNVDALLSDPAYLAAVLDEFLAETDPTRLERIRLVLGQLDDAALVPTAQSMIFSGNPASADAGLDLLRDIGATVPEARNVALDVLSSTQDPEMLVGATNVMVVASSDDPAVTQRVVSSLSALVQHPDPRVRRASYSTLARWSKDPSVTATLLQGLTDEDPNVRKSTAYGFVGHPNADSSVIEALLNTAENDSNTRRARRGAALALRDMPLDESQQVRLQAVQQQLN